MIRSIQSCVIALFAISGCTEEAPIHISQITVDGASFTIAQCDPADLRLHWKNDDGEIYGSASALAAAYEANGERLLFCTNAGIFTPEFAPAGLHIEQGEELRPLNTNEGPGNFHLMPNGVFYIDDKGAQICTTETYSDRAPSPRLATQSGPMLLIDNAIHPAFNENSVNLRVRSGVGVNAKGQVVIALSHLPVSFYNFATMFRDTLDCENALYLDGTLSFIHAPDHGAIANLGGYAGLLAVATKDSSDE